MDELDHTIRELVSGDDWKATLDTLILFANKPVNYATLQNLRHDFFLVALRDFIKQRHVISDLEIENTIAKVEDTFRQDGVDLFTFQGIKLPVTQTVASNTGAATNYYALEEYFQYTLYDICQEKIKPSVMDAVHALPPFQKKILKVYVDEYLPFASNQHRIHIDSTKFLQLSKVMFYKEEAERLNFDSIKDVLVRCGMGYRYEPTFICPFWYTIKDELGRRFRTMVSEELEAQSNA